MHFNVIVISLLRLVCFVLFSIHFIFIPWPVMRLIFYCFPLLFFVPYIMTLVSSSYSETVFSLTVFIRL